MSENQKLECITINSTDEERTRILSNKILKVVEWDKKKELVITNPNESTEKALRRYSVEQGLRDKEIYFSDFSRTVRFTRSTLRESITQMSKRGANLDNLGKLMSVLELVCKNAVLIEVEKYRHVSRKRQDVEQVHQLISAFYAGEKAYPVKITIQENKKQPDQFYMVITVGEIDIKTNLKEALTNTGAACHLTNGSLPDGGASCEINITDFIKNFKRNESIIIKNLPDGLLNRDQQFIKLKVIDSDLKKECLMCGKMYDDYELSSGDILLSYEDSCYRLTDISTNNSAQGKTFDEAKENLEMALELCENIPQEC